jgi:LmbE family N-acetylglucosaminyl deacetylase
MRQKRNIMVSRPEKVPGVIIFCLISFVFFYNFSFAQDSDYQKQLDPFVKGERVLIFSPHPDDEAIACAGVIQEALSKGAKVKIAYLTYGEHNQFAFIVYKKRIILKKKEFINLGQIRRKESIKAMQLLGLNEDDLVFLGYPDFGTFSIFTRYWNTDKPFRSFLTRISSVPYKESPSFNTPYLGENILKDIKRVILDYRPDKVFVSHPADVNVDHKSLYLFLQIALAELRGDIPSPKVYSYLVHHVGWPLPRHYHPNLSLKPPAGLLNSQITWLNFNLTPEQLEKKRKAILCYKSQTESSAFYLLAFARKNELFGDYPDINLNKQLSVKENNISFFGLSKMFPDIGSERQYSESNILEPEGRVSYAILDKDLVIKIEKPEDIVYRFSTVTYIFGYNYKIPFSDMPKIRIITKHNNFMVFDGKRLINPKNVSLELSPKLLILKVPLEALRFPGFILASVRSYIGRGERKCSPVYVTGFRKININ